MASSKKKLVIQPRERLVRLKSILSSEVENHPVSDGAVWVGQDTRNDGFWLKWKPKADTHTDYFYYSADGSMVDRDTSSPLSTTAVTEERGDELLVEVEK